MKDVNILNKFKLNSFQNIKFLLNLPPGHNSLFYCQKSLTEFSQNIVYVLFCAFLSNSVSMDIAVANCLYK